MVARKDVLDDASVSRQHSSAQLYASARENVNMIYKCELLFVNFNCLIEITLVVRIYVHAMR